MRQKVTGEESAPFGLRGGEMSEGLQLLESCRVADRQQYERRAAKFAEIKNRADAIALHERSELASSLGFVAVVGTIITLSCGAILLSGYLFPWSLEYAILSPAVLWLVFIVSGCVSAVAHVLFYFWPQPWRSLFHSWLDRREAYQSWRPRWRK